MTIQGKAKTRTKTKNLENELKENEFQSHLVKNNFRRKGSTFYG